MWRSWGLWRVSVLLPAPVQEQTADNVGRWLFPSEADVMVYSMYRKVYSNKNPQPLGNLEVSVSVQELFTAPTPAMRTSDCSWWKTRRTSSMPTARWTKSKRRRRSLRRWPGGRIRLSPSAEILFFYPFSLNRQACCWRLSTPTTQFRQNTNSFSSQILLLILSTFLLFCSCRHLQLGSAKAQDSVNKIETRERGGDDVIFTDDRNDEISLVNQTLSQLLDNINRLIQYRL